MPDLFSFESLIAFLTLTLLEVVLGIDNVVFIAILVQRLEENVRDKARKIGLALAMLTRVALLFSIAWIMRLTAPLFTIFDHTVNTRDLILLGGGLFLIGKATFEIHEKLEGPGGKKAEAGGKAATFKGVIIQILILDLVFSLDSVITAVGMVQQVPIMVAAVIVAVLVMLVFAGHISRFIEGHPTLKMLALAFLLLIGVMLVAEGCGQHIEKGYIYFAMAFSLFVELLNLRVIKIHNPIKLRSRYGRSKTEPD